MVTVLSSQSRSRPTGFNFQPSHCHVTPLSTLFTQTHACFLRQTVMYNVVLAKGQCCFPAVKATVGMAESNGSLMSGLLAQSPVLGADCLQTRISFSPNAGIVYGNGTTFAATLC